MICGLDTTILVHAELSETSSHPDTVKWLGSAVQRSVQLAIAPQVLSEFVHIATDPSRFARLLSVSEALERSQKWWTAPEVAQIYPNDETLSLFHAWMRQHRLGRKRVLDTLLAATYVTNGVGNIFTTDLRDFAIFDSLRVHVPRQGQGLDRPS